MTKTTPKSKADPVMRARAVLAKRVRHPIAEINRLTRCLKERDMVLPEVLSMAAQIERLAAACKALRRSVQAEVRS